MRNIELTGFAAERLSVRLGSVLVCATLLQAAMCVQAAIAGGPAGAAEAPQQASNADAGSPAMNTRSEIPFICGALWFPQLTVHHKNLAVIHNEVQPGVTHLEGYYCWRYLEPQRGRWDFSSADESYQAMRAKGLRLVAFPWVQYAPQWFTESPDYVPLREVGTGLTVDLLSPWAPGTLRAVEHFYDGLQRHQADKIDIMLIGVPTSDFGEVGLVIGAPAFVPGGAGGIHRFFPQKAEAWHQGLWCGDRYARESFRQWALKRYGSLSAVNRAWGASFGAEDAVAYPDLATRHDHRRWWVDFMLWYEGSQVAFVERVVAIIRQRFGGILLEAALGFGDDNPRPALDRTAVCRALAKFKPFAIRSTHAGVNRGAFNQAYWFYKRMVPVCRRFGAAFGTEPPGGDLTVKELKQQMFEDASAGVDYVYTYFQNYKLLPDTVEQFKRLLRPGEAPLVDIGILYPTSDLLLEMVPFPPDQIPFCSAGREFFDYDVVDENMIDWGMLADYRVLIHTGGKFLESATLAKIDQWVRDGGLLIARADSWLQSVEGDRAVHASWQKGAARTAAGGKAKVFSVGRGAVVLAEAKSVDGYLANVVAVLGAAGDLLGWTNSLNGFDGADDHTWTTDFPTRQLRYDTRSRTTTVGPPGRPPERQTPPATSEAKSTPSAEDRLVMTCPQTGVRVLALTNQTSPRIRLVLPGQPLDRHGVEVEFPEVVMARQKDKPSQTLFMVDRRPKAQAADTKVPPYQWKLAGNALSYQMDLGRGVSMIAHALPESDGVRLRLSFANASGVSYADFCPIVCPQFGYDPPLADRRLERTWVHHAEGFELLAVDFPERLTEPLQDWVQSRVHAYRRPPAGLLPAQKNVAPEFQRGFWMQYNNLRPIDDPVIATTSTDGQWVAATYSPLAGHVWSNPDWTCQHSDVAASLPAGGKAVTEVKFFLFRGTLKDLPAKLALERVRHGSQTNR